MQQELWGRHPAPPGFQLPGWFLGSCSSAPMGGWSFAPQARAWLPLCSWGCDHEVLLPLPHAACPLQAQQCHFSLRDLLVAAALPQPFYSHPVHPICGVDRVTTSAPRAHVWDAGCRDKCNRTPTSKRCVFPDDWLDIFPKASWRRWVFREDLNKEREEAWQLHLGLHQPLTICVLTLCAAVALSLLSCWWLWFLLCLFIFTPLLNFLLLNSLFLLAPDKLLSLISLKLLPLNNL